MKNNRILVIDNEPKVQEYQGTIVVERETGKGTTAILTLPLFKKDCLLLEERARIK